MLPTLLQFQELTKACELDRLNPSLNLLFGDLPETRIRGFIEGYDITLNKAFLHYIYPLSAYKWLENQRPFILAQKKLFPETDNTCLESQISWIMQELDNNLKLGNNTQEENKIFVKKTMRQVTYKMQLRPNWIAMLSKCLCAYHYPTSPNMGKMREKSIEAGKKMEDALQAVLQITEFSEYMLGLPLPDLEFIHKLEILSDILKPESVNQLTPIKRADSSFMERLFVIQLANAHARLFQRNDGIPAVITDLFYLEGFSNPLDERTVRRVCNEQEERRSKAELLKYQTAPIGQLIVKK